MCLSNEYFERIGGFRVSLFERRRSNHASFWLEIYSYFPLRCSTPMEISYSSFCTFLHSPNLVRNYVTFRYRFDGFQRNHFEVGVQVLYFDCATTILGFQNLSRSHYCSNTRIVSPSWNNRWNLWRLSQRGRVLYSNKMSTDPTWDGFLSRTNQFPILTISFEIVYDFSHVFRRRR